MIIRPERVPEFQLVYDLVKVSFQTARVANGREQDYVNNLRIGGNYIAELALVAEEDTRIVGHIMLTKTFVSSGNSKFEALLLAPLSVALEYRSRGIGSKLVLTSFERAKYFGYKAIFVVGDPAYYSRFGFKSTVLFGIRHVPPIPDQYVMVHELITGALTGVTGNVTFT